MQPFEQFSIVEQGFGSFYFDFFTQRYEECYCSEHMNDFKDLAVLNIFEYDILNEEFI